MTREEVQKLTEEVISELKADGVDLRCNNLLYFIAILILLLPRSLDTVCCQLVVEVAIQSRSKT